MLALDVPSRNECADESLATKVTLRNIMYARTTTENFSSVSQRPYPLYTRIARSLRGRIHERRDRQKHEHHLRSRCGVIPALPVQVSGGLRPGQHRTAVRASGLGQAPFSRWRGALVPGRKRRATPIDLYRRARA